MTNDERRTPHELAAIFCRCHATSLQRYEHDARCPFLAAVDLFEAERSRLSAAEAASAEWRKAVDLIRAPLVKFAGKALPELCCSSIAEAIMEVLAERDALRRVALAAAAAVDLKRARERGPSDALMDSVDAAFAEREFEHTLDQHGKRIEEAVDAARAAGHLEGA